MQTAPEAAEMAGFPGKGEEVGLIPGAAQNQNFYHLIMCNAHNYFDISFA
jgi:hypothetical protein